MGCKLAAVTHTASHHCACASWISKMKKKANYFQQLLGKEYEGENNQNNSGSVPVPLWRSGCPGLKGESVIRRDAEKSPLACESNELWKNVLKRVGILETKSSQARWGNFLLDKKKQRAGWFSLWGEVMRRLLQRVMLGPLQPNRLKTIWKRRWEGKICRWHRISVAVKTWGSCSDGLCKMEWLQGWMCVKQLLTFKI